MSKSIPLSPTQITSKSGALRYKTRTIAASATIPSTTNQIIVGGYSTEGDCPDHTYAWQSSQPTYYDSRCYFADVSTRGGYWVVSETNIDPRYFGAKGDRFMYENFVLSTSSPNQVTTTNGRFTTADIGKVIGFETGGPAVAATFRIDIITGIYATRTMTLNGQTFTFVASGATGFQVNTDSTSTYQTALNIAAHINANSATYGCTATVPTQPFYTSDTSMVLTANTAGTSGNSITFSTTCEMWMCMTYNPVFYGGLASGPLITTITSVSGTFGGNQTIGIAGTVLASATNVFGTGGTDDYLALKAAISMTGQDDGFPRVLGTSAPFAYYGVRKLVITPHQQIPVTPTTVYKGWANSGYLTSQPLLLLNGTCIDIMNGAAIAALPGFPTNRAIIETGVSYTGFGGGNSVPTISVKIYGPGNIEANGFADRCVWLKTAQYCVLDGDLRCIAASYKAVEIGGAVGTYNSWSNTVGNIVCQSKGSKTNNNATNSPDSVGYHLSTATDHSHTGKIECIGYRYGCIFDRTCHIPHGHNWTWQGGGPMKASYLFRGGKSSLPTYYSAGYLESDTPSAQGDPNVGECYAFWFINSGATILYGYNTNAASGGSIASEVVFCRNEGTNYNPSNGQSTITFVQAYQAGITLKRPAIGMGGIGGYLESLVRFIGGLKTDTFFSQSGFASYSIEPNAYKNVLPNSNFEVWRNTGSTSVTTNGGVNYSAEGWRSITDATTGTRTIQQGTTTGGSTTSVNQYSLQITQSSLINGTYHQLNVRLPRSIMFAISNKPLTIFSSIRLVSGTFNTGITFDLFQNFGTGGSASVTTTNIGVTYPNSGGDYSSINFICPSVNGKTITSDAYVELRLNIPISANTGTWQINIDFIELVMGYASKYERVPNVNVLETANLLRTYYETGSVYAPSTTAFWVPFKSSKYKTPAVTVTNGTASQISTEGFLVTPTGAGACAYTADASI